MGTAIYQPLGLGFFSAQGKTFLTFMIQKLKSRPFIFKDIRMKKEFNIEQNWVIVRIFLVFCSIFNAKIGVIYKRISLIWQKIS